MQNFVFDTYRLIYYLSLIFRSLFVSGILILQANSVTSASRMYSDVDSGDDEESPDSRNTATDTSIQVSDEVDESKFFAGVFTSERSEEDLAGLVKHQFCKLILQPHNKLFVILIFYFRYHTFFEELGDLQTQLGAVGSSIVKLNDVCSKSSMKDFSKSSSTAKVDTHSLKILKNVADNASKRHAYCTVASRVRSIINFVKVAYPDMIGGDGLGKAEPLNAKDRKVCRAKLLTCVERGLHAAVTMQEVVYDLDALANSARRKASDDERFGNWDEKKIGKRGLNTKQLQFESRFESGNLRKAIQVCT